MLFFYKRGRIKINSLHVVDVAGGIKFNNTTLALRNRCACVTHFYVCALLD